MSAFWNGFKEAQKGVYTFQDTSAGTLDDSSNGHTQAIIQPFSTHIVLFKVRLKRQEMLRIKLWKTGVRRTL
jgi:hypothetical protein